MRALVALLGVISLLSACGGGGNTAEPTADEASWFDSGEPTALSSQGPAASGLSAPERESAAAASTSLAAADCSLSRLGAPVAASAIGEATNGATFTAATWVDATATTGAYCQVEGAIAPVDVRAKDIRFAVGLPASWNKRSVHLGGGGMNGTVGNPGGNPLVVQQRYVAFKSDSGHSTEDGLAWALNDEAVRNFGHLQLKKTRDVAMQVVQRAFGQLPEYNYFYGGSQGGREAMTVVQRYGQDYNGVVAIVPVIEFSTLTLSPVLNQIQRIPAANYVPEAKGAAISALIMRRCDGLDGLMDGLISNYSACRDIFDTTRGAPNRQPWAQVRCPNNIDPNPNNTGRSACLTDGQIDTLHFLLRPYRTATALANGVTEFGGYLPGPGTVELLKRRDGRYAGQEGGGTEIFSGYAGEAMVTGALMRNLDANPLTYVEGGSLNSRRVQMSQWMDATNPNLNTFYQRGGKLIMSANTDDTLGSPASQLNYMQAVLDSMGRTRVNEFARFYVLPQSPHGSDQGTNVPIAGNGDAVPALPLPAGFDRFGMLTAWVERGVAPSMSVVGRSKPSSTGLVRSRPVCSYPAFPYYIGGDVNVASSFECRMN
jgi:hypothetical protein